MKTLTTMLLVLSLQLMSAQNPAGFTELTPQLVDQSQSNGNLRGNGYLQQARKIFLAGGTHYPGGIKKGYTKEAMVASFEKNHSRQGRTDGIFYLPAGTPVFWIPGEDKPRYPYCLNKFSDFKTYPTRVEYVQAEQKENVVINNYYVEGKSTSTDNERVIEGGYREVQERPAPQQSQQVQQVSQYQGNCDVAIALAMQVVTKYQNASMFYSKSKAQERISELQMTYPGCLNGFSIERANKGARWLENNAIDIVHLGYDVLSDQNHSCVSCPHVGTYNPGNSNPSDGGNYNPGSSNPSNGGSYNPGNNASATAQTTSGMFSSYINK